MRHPAKAELVLMLVTMLASMGAAAWEQMSPAQREMTVITWRGRAKKILGWAARRAGYRGMSHELAGRPDGATLSYSLARRLAELRDRV